MLELEPLIERAKEAGASDLHLEGGLPLALRVQGDLRMSGEALPAADISALAHRLLGDEGWTDLQERGACDLSRTIHGIRCRINVLRTARGVGLAVRLLSAFQATLTSLNLHPDLKKLAQARHGLVMVSGPTGSGKSSTVAAILQEINLTEPRHILTIESPIEHVLTPRAALIRQRQVGRDTPSFEQALIDALREDPDVIMVGEMRDPETMRLTLNAAETGHLVLTTVHSSTAAEALSRVVSAFPAEVQAGICAQLADCLTGVVCQKLRYWPELKMRVPECEILVPSSGVRGTIRGGQLSRLATAVDSGGQEGQWTWARYRAWLEQRTDWARPSERSEPVPAEPLHEPLSRPTAPKPAARPVPTPSATAAPKPARAPVPTASPIEAQGSKTDGVLIIEDVDEDPASILERLQKRG